MADEILSVLGFMGDDEKGINRIYAVEGCFLPDIRNHG